MITLDCTRHAPRSLSPLPTLPTHPIWPPVISVFLHIEGESEGHPFWVRWMMISSRLWNLKINQIFLVDRMKKVVNRWQGYLRVGGGYKEKWMHHFKAEELYFHIFFVSSRYLFLFPLHSCLCITFQPILVSTLRTSSIFHWCLVDLVFKLFEDLHCFYGNSLGAGWAEKYTEPAVNCHLVNELLKLS